MPIIEPELTIPKKVRDLCRQLTDAGESAYIVGGSIRDLFGERKPVDWDVATTARPERVMEIFDRVIPTGIDHGTVTVLMGGQSFEVTTLRGDGAYSDGRHPDNVVFIKDISEDLARRDFTINAMAFEPITGKFHDPFGGYDDLAQKTIRAVGNPAARFAEDGLRVLRAARFAAVLGFELDPTTRDAIPAAAARLAQVSAERKRDELVKLLLTERPSIGLEIIEQTEMLPNLLPVLAKLVGRQARAPGPADAWRHTVARVDAVPAQIHLRLAALLADLGRSSPKTTGTYPVPVIIKTMLDELRLDRRTRARVSQLLTHLSLEHDSQWTDADLRRLLHRVGREHIDDQLDLEVADLALLDDRERLRSALTELRERLNQLRAGPLVLSIGELEVNGTQLVEELGIPPGPLIGKILDTLLKRILDSPEDNRPSRLIQLAKKIVEAQK